MSVEEDERSTALKRRVAVTLGPDTSFAVSVIAGPNLGGRWVVDGASPSRVLVGSSPVCDVRLTDPSVSRRHLALEIIDDRLHLTDLGSSNGTAIEGVNVLVGLVAPGQRIRIGETTLEVEACDPTAEPVPPATSFGRMVGISREMRRLYPLCKRLAEVNVPVVIEGETGTGKEALAEAIHEEGPRASGPFVVFDCTAVPANLIESELFGHERGAFTGAVEARPGVFEQAHKGTLLIDEIGDLDLPLQGKLLRAIERCEVRRLGGTRWTKFDVRLLAATRRDLDRAVQDGRFRDDLWHRIAVARIELPPLRSRHGDIQVLAEGFARDFGAAPENLDPALFARWAREEWPGNVRQLRNAVARSVALGPLAQQPTVASRLGEPEESTARDFAWILDAGLPLVPARQKLVDAFERHYIQRVLKEHDGDVAAAAAASGIARRYFNLLRARHR